MPSVQDYARDRVVLELKKKLNTDLGIGKLNFEPFSTIGLSDLYIKDRSGDEILRINRLFANADIYALLFDKEIIINSVYLSDFEAKLWKETPESELNIQFILDAFKSDKEPASKPLFELGKISTLSITDGRFRYDIKNQEVKPNTFDANHIYVYDWNTRLSIKSITKDSINIQSKRLELKEQSGFQINNLIVRLLGNEKRLAVKGFKLSLPQSYLQFENCILEENGTESNNFIDKLSLECKIANSYITLSDISAFVPKLQNFKDRLHLNATVKGSINNLLLEDLTLDYGDKMNLKASGSVENVRYSDKMFLQGYVNDFIITKEGVEGLVNNLSANKQALPKQLSQLGTISFRGDISGYLNNLQAKGNFGTELGEITTDANFGVNNGKGTPTFFSGNISATNFKLGQLLENKQMNLLSFNLSVDVEKPNHAPLRGSIEGLVEQFDYNNYTYKNISLDGVSDGLKYIGSISIDDANGYISATGLFDFEDEIPNFDFTAYLKNIRLDELHLAEKYKQSYLSSTIRANVTGTNIEDLQGHLIVDSLSFAYNQKRFLLNELYISSSINDSEQKQIAIKSDILNGEIEGNYTYKTLINSLKETAQSVFPQLLASNPNKPQTTKKNNKKEQEIELHDNLTFRFTVGNTESLSSILSLPVVVYDSLLISGMFDKKTDKANLDVNMPTVKAAGMNIRNGELHIQNESGKVNSTLDAVILGKNDVQNTLNLNIDAFQDQIFSKIKFSNNNIKSVKGEIAFRTEFSRNEIDHHLQTNVNISPSEMSINDSLWYIDQSQILVSNGSLSIHNFAIANAQKTQYLRADGKYSVNDESDVLLLNLKDIDLEYVFTTLDIKALEFGGLATGTIFASSKETKPYAKVDLNVKGMKFNQTLLGDLELHSDFDDSSNYINMQGLLYKYQEKELIAKINGYIDPIKQGLSLNFDANKIDVGFLNKYTSALFNNISGIGTGNVHLYGDFSDVTVEGKAFIENGSLGINMLNTSYSFTDTVYMKSDLIYFNNIKLSDSHGNIAKVSGQVSHNYFTNFLYQVNLSGNNFLLYNVAESQSPFFYGQVYASGTGSISGDEQEVNIDMRLRTEAKTKVHMNFMEESANQYSFITYKSKQEQEQPEDDASSTKDTSRKLQSQSGIGINMNIYVDATPDASVELLMDPVGGDVLGGNGSGSLHFIWGTNTEPLLYGTYTIQRGNYNFTFQKILERKFVIDSGSTVQFRGDPFTALLDVTAIYRLNANLNDLSTQLAGSTGQGSTPVQCILKLTGELRHPNVGLDIALPSVDSEIQRQVRNLLSTEDMMNRQIVYLLLMSKFYTSDDARTGNQTSDLASVASATLSAQLSNVLSQIDDRWQFGANVRTTDAGFTQTEVDLILSSHLLNDRLIINGNFGYRDNSQNPTSMIRDVDIEYLLGKHNTWRIKAYNHYNEKYYIRNSDRPSVETQGVGIMYKKDFDYVKEIFGLKRKQDSTEIKNDSIVLPDSTITGSHLGKFIRIKEP